MTQLRTWFLLCGLAVLSVRCSLSPTLSDEAAPRPDAPHANRRRAAALRGSDPTDLCVRLVTSLGASYRALFESVHGAIPLSDRGPSYAISTIPMADCTEDRYARPLHLFNTELAENTGRIGVLLPLTGSSSQKSQPLLHGIEEAFTEAKRDFARTAVVRDTAGTPSLALQQLADLVFNHEVAMVLAAVTPAEAQVLAPWADKLDLPMLFLTREEGFVGKSRFAFRVFPDEKMLGESLAEAARTRGYQRIGILRPDNGKADRMTTALKASLQERKVETSIEATYTPGNFKSMDAAVKKLFNIDEATRADEYRELVHDEQERARKLGHKYNPRQVILKPQVTFDALFLPDDFRMVRHFVKLLEYNGVKRLPLLGSFEWRSSGLVDPPEPFLRDAFFADFIGSYDQLPAPLKKADITSPLFADPATVKDIDFELVGYRAASIALTALSGPEVKRWKLVSVLEKMQTRPSGFFPAASPFTKDHNSFWPAFVFFLTDQARSTAAVPVEDAGGD